MLLFAILALLLTSSPALPAAYGEINTLESVPDLEKAMYATVQGYPCVRLLNLSGEIGCSNPGREKVVAPIVRQMDIEEKLDSLSAVLISMDEMQKFFLRVSSDIHFAQKIAGVLIEPNGYENILSGFSPVEKFPQASFAPYQNVNYEWNPAGSGIMWGRYNFPVFLLSSESTSIIQQSASKNAKTKTAYPVDVAEFDLVMQTTKFGTHDSESCLKERSCLPLGGYSVWTSLPPIKFSSMEPAKPIILVLASQDSASFFRDLGLGADSPISGLIALLAAVDALSHLDGTKELKKQLVFAVFTGEAWGYLGSRRFMHELESGGNATKGLNSTLIEQVLEIGSVGKGLSRGVTTFFAHSEGDSSKTKEMLRALQSASDSLGSDNVRIKVASESNPGIPPSSMMTILRKNLSASGVVLEDFDSAFTNKFYHSHLDNQSNINSSSIAGAGILVARALYALAIGDATLDLAVLNSIKVNLTLVEELVGCMLTCDPGLSCDVIRRFISPENSCPSHYVGVFLDTPSDAQNPRYVDDTARFIWNFLADRTSVVKGNTSPCTSECPNEADVCIRAETASKGTCVTSTTRYVPAYSTRLNFENYTWHVMPANVADSLGLVDPVWTESFWDTIGLQVYTVQSSNYDHFILLVGVSVTVAAYIAISIVRLCLGKALKRD